MRKNEQTFLCANWPLMTEGDSSTQAWRGEPVGLLGLLTRPWEILAAVSSKSLTPAWMAYKNHIPGGSYTACRQISQSLSSPPAIAHCLCDNGEGLCELCELPESEFKVSCGPREYGSVPRVSPWETSM